MGTYLADRLDIADLMTGWIHRDNGESDQLRELFYPEATIEITWFKGKATDFVNGSMKMGTSDFKTKHLIALPVVTFHGTKAITETNAIVVGFNTALRLGCEAHCRFYDHIEKRDGAWKILERHIYDMASFTFPYGIVELDTSAIQKYPIEYAPLTYLLQQSGFPVTSIYPTKGSDLDKTIKAEGKTWLKA
jgi:hypothetical protein